MAYKPITAAELGLILFVSCKKDNVTENPSGQPSLPTYVIKSAIHTPSALVNHKYVYTFNAKAQVTERKYFFPATSATNSSTVTYSYDSKGRLTSTTSTSTGNPNVNGEEYLYDDEDRLVTKKTFINTNPSGTSTYAYNGQTITRDQAGLVTYTATLDNAGNIMRTVAEFTNNPTQNYIGEWLEYDNKPIVNEFPINLRLMLRGM